MAREAIPRLTDKAPRGTQSIQRTMSVLDAFRAHEGWLSLRLVAERVSLPKPTTHRILNALASTGLVEGSTDGSYRLGPRATELGLRATLTRLDSPPRATPFTAQSLARSSSFGWRDWNGAPGADGFDPTFEREVFAIRHGAGVLDVSPLFLYEFRGPQAEAALQRIVTRDVSRCRTDQVMYTAWCDDEGRLLQDGNLVRLARDHFRLSAGEPSLRWFQDAAEGLDCEIVDIGDGVAKLAVQGPLSRTLLAGAGDVGGVLDPVPGAEPLGSLAYFRATGAAFEGHPLVVTRTGFTGDLGYEIWFDLPAGADGAPDPEPARRLLDALLDSPLAPAVCPMGLAALDVARIEAGLILIDVDYFNASHTLVPERCSTPDEAGLGWTVKLVPGNDFIGRRAIEAERARGVRWAFVGLATDWAELERVTRPRGVRPHTVGRPVDREPSPVRSDEGGRPGMQVGQVTSSVFSPRLKRQLALATVRADHARRGTSLWLETRVETDRVPLAAAVTPLPFYDPPHKRS